LKRVRPQSLATAWPKKVVTAGTKRSFVAPTELSDELGNRFVSGCLSCPDEPCVRFDPVELAGFARIDSPYSPDHSVCPTGAISRNDGGHAEIDASSCIGCGLCVVRCPVGAIWVDEGVATATVEAPNTSSYERRTSSLEEFIGLRNSVEVLLEAERPPWKSGGLLAKQVNHVSRVVQGASGTNALRLLARNTFLIGGAAARLKNVGDNNAACELLVDDGTHLLVVEVESGGDSLDAMRRVLAGTAVVVARYGVRPEDVTPTLILTRLPNKRVDYYGVAADVQARLGLTTITIPTAVLLLYIRVGDLSLESLISDVSSLGELDGEVPLLTRFGQIDALIKAGLVPAK
jgi:ferredoxin